MGKHALAKEFERSVDPAELRCAKTHEARHGVDPDFRIGSDLLEALGGLADHEGVSAHDLRCVERIRYAACRMSPAAVEAPESSTEEALGLLLARSAV